MSGIDRTMKGNSCVCVRAKKEKTLVFWPSVVTQRILHALERRAPSFVIERSLLVEHLNPN
jgi:hypothetical protein